MNFRLGWKIFLIFWAALWLATGLPMILLVSNSGLPDPDKLRQDRLQSAEVLMHYAGREVVDAATAHWPRADRAELARSIASPGQAQTEIRSPPREIGAKYWGYAIHVVVGVVISSLLAFYIARPLLWLRDGLRGVAQGHLDVRVAHRLGNRRDEVADLARDFDAMTERLELLMSERERILHDLSHELRSPLARLSVAVGLAGQSKEFSSQILARLERESARLSAILESFLTLSRLEARNPLDLQYFDLLALLDVVCEDAHFEGQPRGVQVRREIEPRLSSACDAAILEGEPELIRQALDNVVRNAVRYSPPGGVVHVTVACRDARVEIMVSDEGEGVSCELQDRMFEPFVKGSGKAPGIGLGLSIAKRAVQVHGGLLRARNGIHGGLSVTMSLPFSALTSESLVPVLAKARVDT